ncbi:MAG: hypothetical protein ACFFB8_15940 [Promethearchaeota archaeon]
MLKVEFLKLQLEEDIQLKINNWLLTNQNKKFRFIQHTYVPPVILLVPVKDTFKKEREIYKAQITETQGYLLVAIYHESEIS